MSVPFLVSEIQERFRFRCALPAFASDTNVTTADALTLVQESVRRLCGIMNDLSQEAYFATSADLVTTAGVPVVSLPTNFDKLLAPPCWVRSGQAPLHLFQADLQTVGPTDPLQSWLTQLPTYRLVGNTLEFFPTPQSVETVNVRYSTGLFPTSAGDTVFMQLGWDEWVVLDCCKKVRERQEKDTQQFAIELLQVQQEIVRQAHRRDRAGYGQPRDVRSPRSDWWGRGWAYDWGWWRL